MRFRACQHRLTGTIRKGLELDIQLLFLCLRQTLSGLVRKLRTLDGGGAGSLPAVAAAVPRQNAPGCVAPVVRSALLRLLTSATATLFKCRFSDAFGSYAAWLLDLTMWAWADVGSASAASPREMTSDPVDLNPSDHDPCPSAAALHKMSVCSALGPIIVACLLPRLIYSFFGSDPLIRPSGSILPGTALQAAVKACDSLLARASPQLALHVLTSSLLTTWIRSSSAYGPAASACAVRSNLGSGSLAGLSVNWPENEAGYALGLYAKCVSSCMYSTACSTQAEISAAESKEGLEGLECKEGVALLEALREQLRAPLLSLLDGLVLDSLAMQAGPPMAHLANALKHLHSTLLVLMGLYSDNDFDSPFQQQRLTGLSGGCAERDSASGGNDECSNATAADTAAFLADDASAETTADTRGADTTSADVAAAIAACACTDAARQRRAVEKQVWKQRCALVSSFNAPWRLMMEANEALARHRRSLSPEAQAAMLSPRAETALSPGAQAAVPLPEAKAATLSPGAQAAVPLHEAKAATLSPEAQAATPSPEVEAATLFPEGLAVMSEQGSLAAREGLVLIRQLTDRVWPRVQVVMEGQHAVAAGQQGGAAAVGPEEQGTGAVTRGAVQQGPVEGQASGQGQYTCAAAEDDGLDWERVQSELLLAGLQGGLTGVRPCGASIPPAPTWRGPASWRSRRTRAVGAAGCVTAAVSARRRAGGAATAEAAPRGRYGCPADVQRAGVLLSLSTGICPDIIFSFSLRET